MKNFAKQLVSNYQKKTNGNIVENQQQALPLGNNSRYMQVQQQALTYQECPQQGEHTGELLSLVCVEPDCIKQVGDHYNILLCCICQEKQHNGHKVKTLKAILRKCSNYIQERKQVDNKPSKIFDKETIMMELIQQEQKVKETINVSHMEVMKAFDLQKETISELFNNLKLQIEAEQVSEIDVEHFQNQIYQNQYDIEQISYNIKQLLDVLPSEKKPSEKNVSQYYQQKVETKQVLNQLTQINSDNLQNINTMNTNVKKYLAEFQIQLAMAAKTGLFVNSVQFSFSNEFKHENVTVVKSNIVKVTSGASGYKFAVMTPSLDGLNRSIKFGFKMKEVHQSNWLAIGMCHLDTIIAKNYTFSFSTLGHGAYMISSNGGSWSSTKSAQNNAVKTFKFEKNDSVFCDFDPVGKFLSFKLASTPTNVYKLDYIPTAEHLYPCALFYYNNDEVEFIQPTEIID